MRPILRACTLFCAAIGVSGCPTVDLGETPVAPGSCRPSQAYFEDVIWPEYLAPSDDAKSCVSAAGCHRRDDGRSSLRLTVDPPDQATNYEVTTRFLNCGSFSASSLLTKPLSSVDAHGGGDLFGPADREVDVFSDWFGAP